MLPKDFTCHLSTSELLSVGDLIVNGDTAFFTNWEILKSRIQNESATAGTTTFSGSLFSPSINVNVIELKDSSALNFSGTVTATGSISAPLASCIMPSNATSSYIGLRALCPNATSGTVNMIFGKDDTTNNSATLLWDVSNTRCQVALTGNNTNQLQISSTATNFTEYVVNSSGNQYAAYKTLPTVAFSLTGSQVSTIYYLSPGYSLATARLKEVVITVRNLNYTVFGVPLALRMGYSFVTAPYAYGITEGSTGTNIWTSNVGANIHDGHTVNTPIDSHIRLSWAGENATTSFWSVQITSHGTGSNQYSYGGGIMSVPYTTAGNAQLQFQLVSTTGTCSGSWSINYV